MQIHIWIKRRQERVVGKISHLYRWACSCGQQLSKTDYRSDYSMQITLMSMPKINLRESARFNPALIKKSNEEERGENTCRNGAQNLCALISKPLEPQWCPSLIPPRVSPRGTRVRWLNLSPPVLLSRVFPRGCLSSSALCRIASSYWREIKVQHYGWKRTTSVFTWTCSLVKLATLCAITEP